MTVGSGLSIAVESPYGADVAALTAELDASMDDQAPDTPAELQFRLTPEELARPGTTLWVARIEGRAVGCVALKRHDGTLGEIKRLYVRPAARGAALGEALLCVVETTARLDGLDRLALETGAGFVAARRVYETAGYLECGPFADYADIVYAAYYEKTLRRSATARTAA